jgi:hypothetical protein
MIGLAELEKCFCMPTEMDDGRWSGQLNWRSVFHSNRKGRWMMVKLLKFDQFSDVLQVGCQRKGSMADGWVASFGRVLHVPKGKCQS